MSQSTERKPAVGDKFYSNRTPSGGYFAQPLRVQEVYGLGARTHTWNVGCDGAVFTVRWNPNADSWMEVDRPDAKS